MNEALKHIKQIHKQLAIKIRAYKACRKDKYTGEIPSDWSEWNIEMFGIEARHRHIAYCTGKGTEYDKIEQPREVNKLTTYDWDKINKYKDTYQEMFNEENVRTGKQPA